MGMKQYQQQMTANKALYHVCYKLSQMGWNVMPTVRNAKGVDILCINEEGNKMFSVQVKGRGKRDINDIAFGIPPSRDKIMGDFWIVVTGLDCGTPTCYILFPDEIEEGREPPNKKGEISNWFDRKFFRCNSERFKEKWERIGSGFIGSHTEG